MTTATMRATLSAALAVALISTVGCKPKGDKDLPKGEILEDEVMEVKHTKGEDQGPKLRPSAADFEKLYAPPPCPDPDTPDPLEGSFTLEQALEGLENPSGVVNPTAVIRTNRGNISCELYADRTPVTVANFIGLARGIRDWWNPRTCQWVRKPFYDGLIFHRVIPNFMIQAGCPLKNGGGNPGYTFNDEIDAALHHDMVGLLSMANAGKDPEGNGTNGSQFFILDRWTDEKGPPVRLDGKHTIFGVCKPASTVFQIARTATTGCVKDEKTGRCGQGSNRPLDDVEIKTISISFQ